MLTRGSAVVDNAIVRQSDVHLFLKFDVITMSDVSDEMIHFVSDKCRVPDHSISVYEIIISDCKRDHE